MTEQVSPAISDNEILLLPFPLAGHLGPLLGLAEFLLAEDLKVTLAVLLSADGQVPSNLPKSPNFRYVRIDLPMTEMDAFELTCHLHANEKMLATDVISKCGYDKLRPTVVISDMMAGLWCEPLIDALQIPRYIFYPSPLTTAYTFQHYGELSDLQAKIKSNRDKAHELIIPGVSGALHPSDLVEFPPAWREGLRKSFSRFHLAKGAIVHDLSALYPHAEQLIDAIKDGFKTERRDAGLEDDEPFKIFNIGALCLFNSPVRNVPQTPEIQWLDQQQPRSVIFAALGSFLHITVADTVELARGLQLSGMPFLWGYRGHASDSSRDLERELPEEVDESGLPIHYRRDVEDKGIILPWVNQQAVLQHPAIACFLTHCGWNSSMEALSLAGVPLVLMPVAAEQGINARTLEEECKCGKRLWDMQEGRRLDRRRVAATINECASNQEMKRNAALFKAALNEAVAPGGCVRRTQKQLCASLLQTGIEASTWLVANASQCNVKCSIPDNETPKANVLLSV